MRIKLTLSAKQIVPFELPFNYQVLLQGLIYRIIALVDREYAGRLHNKGYWQQQDGKHYKMFVFSDLMLGKRHVRNNRLLVYNKEIEWYIASPMQDFLQNIVNGFFKESKLNIGKTDFFIKSVETLPEPEYQTTFYFSYKF